MGLFGNSLEAQLGRALIQQDLYRRMFDAYEHRKSAEYAADKKAEEEFWGNYNKLLDSIGSAKSDLDYFYSRTDLHLYFDISKIKDAFYKLEELRKEFADKLSDIPKGDQATGWASFASRESQDYEVHLKEEFIPFALNYFKTITTHLWSIQPLLLMEQSISSAKKNFFDPIDGRVKAVSLNADFPTLAFDRDAWETSWSNYEASKIRLINTSNELVNSWDPWKEKDIEAVMKNYAAGTLEVQATVEIFAKNLARVEEKLEKIWEIRKSVEIANEEKGNSQKEMDNFVKIEKLAKLLESGAITKEEFSAKKAELLKKIE
jgi:hypothetical protein